MAKILIAEDERDIRDLIEFTLTFAGHQVFKAANGAEAVELAPKVMPDLIMMDVRMPRMTGYEACRQIKQIDAVRNIPIVFLSAKGQETEIDTGLDAGAYDYILKPFAPMDLTKRVSEILARFGSTQPNTNPIHS
jgi:DNA-binding response OmpR family regulator